MKYKQFVYTAILTIITALKITVGDDEVNEIEKFHEENVKSSVEEQSSAQRVFPDEFQNDGYEKRTREERDEATSTQSFPWELNQCIKNHQYQITEDYTQGRKIILNCFKTAMILTAGKYLLTSPKSSIKLFNGLVELKRIPEKSCGENGSSNCHERYSRFFKRLANSENKKAEYIKMYKKAMEKLISENGKFKLYRNQTEEERINQLNRINEGSQAFLTEVIKNFNDEEAEKAEEEKLKREITDPKLLTVLDAFSRNYMVKLKFYPGVSARMMRSQGGSVTFDLEISEGEDDADEENVSDEVSTREIKGSKSKGKDYLDDSEEGGNKKKRKKKKKKKKEIKKKAKKLKKIIPYLLLPMLIQMTLLPFVFKKLFFLAMKALFAGKVALILIGFNLLRNTCIKDEDKYAQRIRVEHYGYNKGEEYGAWVNGRSFLQPDMMSALSEVPYRGQQPAAAA